MYREVCTCNLVNAEMISRFVLTACESRLFHIRVRRLLQPPFYDPYVAYACHTFAALAKFPTLRDVDLTAVFVGIYAGKSGVNGL